MSLAQALPPPGGGGPDTRPPGCARDVKGHLSAAPSTIDRTTAQQITTTLTWSVSATSCPTILGFFIDGVSSDGALSGTSGSLISGDVPHTQRFSLMMTTVTGAFNIAATTVEVKGDPGIITLSDGAQISTQDIAQFDAQWMQPWLRSELLNNAKSALLNQVDDQVWWISERMTALSRMYELTHERRYIDHLHEFTEPAMNYRDDLSPQPQADRFRDSTIPPGWGGASPNSGGLYGVEEDVSSMYGYPIATFARLVAEDPGLQIAYGGEAVRYANELLKTVWLFMPQVEYVPDGNRFDGYLKYLDILRILPKDWQCEAAYESACQQTCGAKCDAPDQRCSQDDVNRFRTQRSNCNSSRANAGAPLAYNQNMAFAMMLIELWRTLDSEFYRAAANRSNDADPTRLLIPVLVSRIQHYFVRHLQQAGDRFSWHTREGGPCGNNCPAEGVEHAALDMRYIGILYRNLDRLNAQAVLQVENEPIELDDSRLRGFANTFLEAIASEPNFAANVDGKNHSEVHNGSCDDWLSLSIVNGGVYQACKDNSLRVVNGSQPYLGIGNHSALLRDKWASQPPPPPPDCTVTGCQNGLVCCDCTTPIHCTTKQQCEQECRR